MGAKLICLIEDDPHIRELVKYNLEEKGWEVLTFGSGEDFLQTFPRVIPALFILDIMLPGLDGLDLCRRLKQDSSWKKVPIIMLTAKGEEFDKVLGLELGADDYITKPFSVRELTARVKAVLRRQEDNGEKEASFLLAGQLILDLDRREASKNGHLLVLTHKEFELLKLLMKYKGKVLSRDMLLEQVWGFHYLGETRTVDVHIRYLRQKIEDDANNPAYIETVRGVGYRFSDREDR